MCKKKSLLHIVAVALFTTSCFAQKSLSFDVGILAAYDMHQLDDEYIADPSLTFPAGAGQTRFQVQNPLGSHVYLTLDTGKDWALQSGFEMSKRKVTYFTAFSSNSPCRICDAGVDIPLYSVPFNLLIRLNPATGDANWAVSLKAGLSAQWSGKSDDIFRSSGSSTLETAKKVSVEEVAEGEYRMFLVIDEGFGIGGLFGLTFNKESVKADGLTIDLGFRNQWFNTTSIQVWGYDKDSDSRVNGYNPYSFKFASMYIGLNYTLPWKIGKKLKK
ncbi:MAG: hypothetical protein IT258_07000 [Saprospiraceae bacterium]|nr:hypothetical protein [Saprospiraceae bacterium]